MDMRLAIWGLALFLAACPKDTVTTEDRAAQEGSVAPGDSLVFADRGARQCESDGISLEASAQILIDAGIDVIDSACGIRTGVWRCESETRNFFPFGKPWQVIIFLIICSIT